MGQFAVVNDISILKQVLITSTSSAATLTYIDSISAIS